MNNAYFIFIFVAVLIIAIFGLWVSYREDHPRRKKP
jgi:hypothetical protein